LTRPISASISVGSVDTVGSLSLCFRLGMGRRFYDCRAPS
jgi:hypothetical protein